MAEDLVKRLGSRIGNSRTVTVSPGLYEDIRDAKATIEQQAASLAAKDGAIRLIDERCAQYERRAEQAERALKTSEAQFDEMTRSCLAERDGRLKAESALASAKRLLVMYGHQDAERAIAKMSGDGL